MKTLSATKHVPAGMDKEMNRKRHKNLLRQMRILRKMGNKSTKIDGEVKKMKKSLHRKVQRTCGRDTGVQGLNSAYNILSAGSFQAGTGFIGTDGVAERDSIHAANDAHYINLFERKTA